MAETELSVLSRQCFDRRMDSVEARQRELQAWQTERNPRTSKVIWKFSTEDARVKLKHLYPMFKAADEPDLTH